MTDRSELALQLTDAIVAAKTAAERAGDRAFRAYGLSHRAQAALVAVDLGGPDGARPKEIATQLRVSRAAATTFIQRLETKGLVETTPDPEDDRGVRVALTRRGIEVLLRAGPRPGPSRVYRLRASLAPSTCSGHSRSGSRRSRLASCVRRQGALHMCV